MKFIEKIKNRIKKYREYNKERTQYELDTEATLHDKYGSMHSNCKFIEWFTNTIILMLVFMLGLSFQRNIVDRINTEDSNLSNVVTAPLFREPLRRFTPNDNFIINNYTNYRLDYYNLDMSPNLDVNPNSSLSVPYDSRTTTTFGVFEMDDYRFYALSDDTNTNTYDEVWSSNGEAFNGTFVNIYPQLDSNDIYLNLKNADVTSFFSECLNGSTLNVATNDNANRFVTIVSNGAKFKLDYQDNITYHNSFDKIYVTSYTRQYDNYTYTYTSKIYAYDTSTSRKVLIGCNIEASQVTLNQTNSQMDLYFSGETHYTQYYYLAPYLNSTKLSMSGGGYWFLSDVKLRECLTMDKPTYISHYVTNNDKNSNNNASILWYQFGQLISNGINAFLPFTLVYILPGISVGALIFVPIIFAFAFLLLKMVKKN